MEMEFARLQKLNELQAAIGYKFKDTELLNTALTHTSYVKGDGTMKGWSFWVTQCWSSA